MAYSYDAGTTTPGHVGLVEIASVIRLNNGTFRLTDNPLIGAGPVRLGLSPLQSDSGAFAGPQYYGEWPFTLNGWLYVPSSADDVPGAEEQLRAAFAANLGVQTLLINMRGWANRKQIGAQTNGEIMFTPRHSRYFVATRNFSIPMVAVDPFRYNADAQHSITVPYNGNAVNLPNTGNAPALFSVQFSGPATNPELQNSADATKKIAFTHVLSGTLTVNNNPAPNGISVVSSGGANYYGDLNTYTLMAVPPGGTNVKSVATGVSGGATVTVTYRDTYA